MAAKTITPPADWKQVKLGDIGKVSMCKRIFKHETLSKGSVPFYKISTFGKIADSFISKEIFEEYKRKYPYPKKGEILISASGTIGRTVVFDGEESYFQDSNIVWISNPQNQVSNDFLKYVYLKTKWKGTDGGIISRLYNEDVRSIKFLLPPPPEQEKIVEVLEVWDEYLERISKVIKRKKKVKYGLTQQLLTGKKRLTGFYGKWGYRKFEDILYEHKMKSSENEEVYSVSVHKGLINQIEHLGRSFAAKDTSNYNLVKHGDIVYTKSPTGKFPLGIIKQSKIGNNVIVSPLYGVFTPETFGLGVMLDAYFASAVNVRNFLNPIVQKGAKNTIAITNKTFLSKGLVLPKLKEEQTAIANILTTADKEIEALEKKRALIEAQKKFLLNNLVTGKIRLPEFINAN